MNLCPNLTIGMQVALLDFANILRDRPSKIILNDFLINHLHQFLEKEISAVFADQLKHKMQKILQLKASSGHFLK